MKVSTARGVLSCVLLLIFGGCAREGNLDLVREATSGTESPASKVAGPPLIAPYPRGAWRLADQRELDATVLWVSHILIRYREGKNDEVAFSLASWRSVLPTPTRTREEALALARDVADRARQHPDDFPQLAQKYSEDITTNERGGSLGGVTASQLSVWPQVLDALAELGPGQSSQVVETWYGFHIFRRASPPPPGVVSAAQLVIGHASARWLSVVGRGEQPSRSRSDALALATDVYREAQRAPARFAELVERHSEHRSAAMAGDFGRHSTVEPSWYPRQLEALSAVPIGGITPPIETVMGFEILMRTPDRPRATYAMDSLWLGFAEEAPDTSPESRVSVEARAKQLTEDIGGDPERFSGALTSVCCAYRQQWEDGRGTPALSMLLGQLQMGEVARTPVRSEFSYVVARRIEPAAADTTPPRFELPSPQKPDLRYHVAHIDGALVAEQLERIGEQVAAVLGLPNPLATELRQMHRFPKDLTQSNERLAAFDELTNRVHAVLDEAKFARYLVLVEDQFKAFLLDPANEAMPARLIADYGG